jgi:pyruvate/2-oxoglutarate dehydrogenase complex dihydrolipoamide acyltransferase (E2) component
MTVTGNDADSEPLPQTADYVFRLPDIGEGLVSGEIVEWLVKVGDQVEIDQPVVVIETTKTTAELPTPCGGRVARLHGAVADVVEVGAPLMTIQAPGPLGQPASPVAHLVGHLPAADPGPGPGALGSARRLPPKPAQEQGRVAASPAVRRLARELGVELRGIAGTGNGGAITSDDVHAASRGAPGSAEA